MGVCEGCDRETTIVAGRCTHCGAGQAAVDDLHTVGWMLVPGLAASALAVVLLAPEAMPYALLVLLLVVTVLAIAFRARYER
jgi:membrane protein implicated in regulation of membrane protease activity